MLISIKTYRISDLPGESGPPILTPSGSAHGCGRYSDLR